MTESPNKQYAVSDLALNSADWRGGGLGKAERDLLELGLIAKAVCSGVFVSNRDLDTILGREITPALDGRQVEIEVNQTTKSVNVGIDHSLHRKAVFTGDQGAVLLPIGGNKLFFEPQSLKSEQAQKVDDFAPGVGLKTNSFDDSLLQQAADVAFNSTPDPMTTALVVAHKGDLVLERYADGIQADTQLQSWSMGKTLTAMLLGRLVQMGHLDIDQPAPIRHWQSDARAKITIAHLLQMSSGLNFSASWAQDYDPQSGYPDHSLMYTAGVDVFQLATSRQLSHKPGTFGAYKNGDTLILGQLIRQTVENLGENYHQWPQQALFTPLGIQKLVMETDPYGNFISTGNNFGTARDWVKLGSLLLQEGRWNDQQLIPSSFVEFMRQPAKAWRGQYWTEPGPSDWHDSIYGGQLWLNRYPESDRWPLPSDAYFMLGMGGQYTFVVPSMDLVIVRLGDQLGAQPSGRGCMPEVLKLIVKAYEKQT